eukprot:CAMPEP_0197528440 /NCGR_PEP_ID=MMETSP1318-20131121/25117_1 /TAXON_ID=552666 /ORGANISM="Partenskyella glossopodia, Strain RCC365" /LENGTH=524 /DNA_ID=CAMNT_0043083549 /DNA_START=34 /DNA_END=1608 /DNA_ORIENTATION=+
MPQAAKRLRTESGKAEVDGHRDYATVPPYYASEMAKAPKCASCDLAIPEHGIPAQYAKERIKNRHSLEFSERLNTSSYVTVVFEQEEDDVAMLGLGVNLADQSVYPNSWKMHNDCINMIAKLWNCPLIKEEFNRDGVYAGAGTVGSTEACLLAGIALKKRWEAWFFKKHGKKPAEMKKSPNIVISTMYQAAWEKLFRYMDVEANLVPPKLGTFKIDPNAIEAAVNECTIGVVCIMGNHYGGQYDPVAQVAAELDRINKKHGFQLGIHVDAASGGFIAPFQDLKAPWDFRVPQVLSISASGHKFGQSCAGTGWVVWRKREDLASHIAINVTYLGGSSDSYTLNFSRPATGVYVQYYKFLRLGRVGYAAVCDNMMNVAKIIRDGLKAMKHPSGLPRFEMLDDGDNGCLPVVTARLNPKLNLEYDDIDFQHQIAAGHWYVSGYRMGFHDPATEEVVPLFSDADKNASMFRVVVKANLTAFLADDLLVKIEDVLKKMDMASASGWAPHLKAHGHRKAGNVGSHAHSAC